MTDHSLPNPLPQSPRLALQLRDLLITACRVIGILLIGVCAWLFVSRQVLEDGFGNVFLLLLTGIGGLGLAHLIDIHPNIFTQQLRANASQRIKQLFFCGLGLFLLILEGEVSGKALKIDLLKSLRPPLIQAILFYGGLAIFVVGISGPGLWGWLRDRLKIFGRRDGFILIFILLLGFVLRITALDQPVSTDDGPHMFPIFTFMYPTPDVGLVSPNAWQSSHLYPQLAAFTIRLFGQDLFGLRMGSVFVGMFGILAAFIIADVMVGRRLALLAMLLVATFPPHMHFSRQVMLHITDATVGALGIAFTLRGFKYQQRYDWILAGVFWGLTQYYFEAGRLFFPILFITWMAFIFIFQNKRFRESWGGIWRLVLTLVVTASSVYYAITSTGSIFTVRLNESSNLAVWRGLIESNAPIEQVWTVFLGYLRQSFLVYVAMIETAFYYRGTQPLVLYVLVPFFLLGIFYVLWRFWRQPGIILPIWFFGAVAANIVMREPSHTPRHVIVMAALPIAILIGIDVAYRAISYVIPILKRESVGRVAVVLITVLAVTYQTYYYHVELLPTLYQQHLNNNILPDAIDATLRAVNFPEGTAMYLVGEPLANIDVARGYMGLYRFGSPQGVSIDSITAQTITLEWLDKLSIERDIALFVIPGQEQAVLDVFAQRYPIPKPQDSPRSVIPPAKRYQLYFFAKATRSLALP
jgi:4-amino-4-deoxy-L-arabinose transferase-like glycosyltransferase